jgi:hypothetical protein
MVFWIGILAAILIAWVGVKAGFFSTWTTFFNLLLAVYISVVLREIIIENVSGLEANPYNNALVILFTAAGAFAILYGISYGLVLAKYNCKFHTVIETLGSGIVGFLAGLLLWCFVVYLFSITPLAERDLVQNADIIKGPAPAENLAGWCRTVHSLIGIDPDGQSAIKEELIALQQQMETDTAEPNDTAETDLAELHSLPDQNQPASETAELDISRPNSRPALESFSE